MNVYTAVVETTLPNYNITFSIPGILENLDLYPTAHPRFEKAIQPLLGDEVLIYQFQKNLHEFFYEIVRDDEFVGMKNQTNLLDISTPNQITVQTAVEGVDFEGEDISGEAGKITIHSANEGTVEIKTDDGIFTVEVKELTFTSSDSITIEASGDATIKGTNVNVEASGDATVKGNNVVVEATLSAEIKQGGNSIKTDATGVAVSGLLVSLN